MRGTGQKPSSKVPLKKKSQTGIVTAAVDKLEAMRPDELRRLVRRLYIQIWDLRYGLRR